MTKKILPVLILPALALFSILAAPAAAHASEQKEIGRFGQWVAYEFEENGGKVCYMAAKPQKAEGNYTRRGDIVAMITHRPGEGTKDVFSYMAGYDYREGSDVAITIDGKKFTLFTKNDMAWAADVPTDNALTEAIRRGNKMVAKGVSARGTQTTDTFSLSGSAKAHETITKACGL